MWSATKKRLAARLHASQRGPPRLVQSNIVAWTPREKRFMHLPNPILAERFFRPPGRAVPVREVWLAYYPRFPFKDWVSRELGVTAATLSQWRDTFLEAGESGLRPQPARESVKIGRLREMFGEQAMGNEGGAMDRHRVPPRQGVSLCNKVL